MTSLWERLCQISQRLLVAQTAKDKLVELQCVNPDERKVQLLQSLIDEISLVTIVKSQIEEAMSRAVSEGLNSIVASPNDISNMHSVLQEPQIYDETQVFNGDTTTQDG